jgi:hypothetical protein
VADRKSGKTQQSASRSRADHSSKLVIRGETSNNFRATGGVLVDKHGDSPVIRSLLSPFCHDND